MSEQNPENEGPVTKDPVPLDEQEGDHDDQNALASTGPADRGVGGRSGHRLAP